MTTLDRLLVRFSYIIVGLSFVVVATLVTWMVYPYRVVDDVGIIPILNENKTVETGGVVETLWRINKQTDIRPTVTRFIACDNATSYVITAGFTALPYGPNEVVVPVTIPPVPAPTTCILRWRASYRVNPVREIHADFESEPFEVIP